MDARGISIDLRPVQLLLDRIVTNWHPREIAKHIEATLLEGAGRFGVDLDAVDKPAARGRRFVDERCLVRDRAIAARLQKLDVSVVK